MRRVRTVLRLASTSLVGSVAVLSLVTFAAMAFVLGGVLHDRIRERAIAHDGEAVELLAARLGATVTPAELRTQLDVSSRQDLERFLRLDHHGPEYQEVRVWGTDGRTLRQLGEPVPVDGAERAAVRAALRGEVVRRDDHDTAGGPVLRFAVPVRARGAAAPTGALVTVRDAAAVHTEIGSLSRTVLGIVAVALALLWLGLLPIVAGATRRLRRYAAMRRHQALHDELTGLPNRRALYDVLAGERGADPPGALVVLDADGFKAINTLHGHAHGDRALVLIARTVRAAVPPAIRVARLGGDEFALVVPERDIEAALATARAACTAIGELAVEGRRLGASAGVAVLGAGVADAEALLDRASAALAAAKGRRGAVVAYEPAHDVLTLGLERQREQVEELLADPSLLTPVFQPIVELATGRLVGFEALTRVAGEPPRTPDRWFAQAHRCGLGGQLEALSLRRALATGDRPPGTYLAVNTSPSALRSPAVQAALPDDLTGIVVEITEHELVADATELAPVLAALRARGARIAVDDAGAGYAGLAHLMRIRPDLIKLDRSLVEGIDGDAAKSALAEAFVRFARRTGASLCAEGVETLAELRTLADIDVTTGQGYALGRPAAGWAGVDPDAEATCRRALGDALAGRGGGPVLDGLPLFETLSRRLSDARNLDDVAAIAQELDTAIAADEVALSIWRPESDCVVTISEHGWIATDEHFALADFPATRELLRSHDAVIVRVDDPTADPNEVALLHESGHASVLMMPIVARGRALGLLEAYAMSDRAWTRSDIRRARLVCNQLGPVIESHAGAWAPA